jgi:hypothetical protein
MYYVAEEYIVLKLKYPIGCQIKCLNTPEVIEKARELLLRTAFAVIKSDTFGI